MNQVPNTPGFLEDDEESMSNYIRLRETFDAALSSSAHVNPTANNPLGYAEAFLIMSKYGGSETGYGLTAEHDEMWAGPADTSVVSADDLARLQELGWTPDEEYGGFHRFV